MAIDKVNYADAASVAQVIKYEIRTGFGWSGLSSASKESLDQIATSIARMVAGDGVHWDAIIGYAHAASEKPEKPIERVGTEELERSIRKMALEVSPQRNSAS